MEITCAASTLNRAFGIMHSILPDSEDVRRISYVTVEARQPDTLFVSARNDIGIAVCVQSRVRASRPGTIAFPFHALYRATSFLLDTPLSLTVDRRQIATIRCKSYSAEIAGVVPHKDELLSNAFLGGSSSAQAHLLRRALRRTVIASASRPETALTALRLEICNAQCRLAATDRTRIAMSWVPLLRQGGSSIAHATVPRKAVDALVSLLPNSEVDVSIEVRGNEVVFQWPGALMRTPVLDMEFPVVEKAIPQDFDVQLVIPTSRIRAVIGAVAPIATDRYHTVEAQCQGSGLVIRSDSPEIGSARDTIDLPEPKKRFLLAFNAQHFMQFLDVVDAEKVVLAVKAGEARGSSGMGCLLMPADTDSYKYFVAPIVREY
ncbi:MAG: hypothetical protein FJ290_22235 [Planctomycetes bacterium]|nr:hypothetical protein [Planctomycetota bacterium]